MGMNMKIAVVGSGMAGTTVAWQLAAQGHHVTLFEQADKCGPVGAGILLQPSGQAVLRRLGLLDKVLANSSRIDSLHAVHRTGRTLVHLPYRKVNDQWFGLGVVRGYLFGLLLDHCLSAGVTLREGSPVTSYVETDKEVELISDRLGSMGLFEILIAADGSRSRLREHSGLTRAVQEYRDAALWTIGPYSGPPDKLLQLVGRDGRLVGMLPVGDGRCSFFWGLKKSEEPQVRSSGIDAWRKQVAAFHEAAVEPIADLKSINEMTFSTYRNTRMKRMAQGRVAFIGDAAHATSPHLGQGLNLALEDAVTLADKLAEHSSPTEALASYDQSRRSTINFYTRLTGSLTPFFQTSNRFLQFGRNLALPVMPHLPYVGKQMVYTMAGQKTGWVSQRTSQS